MAGSGSEKNPDFSDEKFVPLGTMVLMVLFVATIAGAWAFVYFTELLARR